MENKYYAPEISEFHVGFEYEWLDDTIGKWEPEVVDINTPLTYFRDDADVEHRVKYLDKQDIESLGFKLYSTGITTDGDIYTLNNKNIVLIINRKSRYIELDNKDLEPYNIKIFKGTIKNKSELKKLMVQLGINEK